MLLEYICSGSENQLFWLTTAKQISSSFFGLLLSRSNLGICGTSLILLKTWVSVQVFRFIVALWSWKIWKKNINCQRGSSMQLNYWKPRNNRKRILFNCDFWSALCVELHQFWSVIRVRNHRPIPGCVCSEGQRGKPSYLNSRNGSNRQPRSSPNWKTKKVSRLCTKINFKTINYF